MMMGEPAGVQHPGSPSQQVLLRSILVMIHSPLLVAGSDNLIYRGRDLVHLLRLAGKHKDRMIDHIHNISMT